MNATADPMSVKVMPHNRRSLLVAIDVAARSRNGWPGLPADQLRYDDDRYAVSDLIAEGTVEWTILPGAVNPERTVAFLCRVK